MRHALLLLTLLSAAMTLVAPAANAAGKSNAPDLKVKLSEEMQAKEDAFERERKKLSKEQKKFLGEMEAVFMATVDPDIQTLKLASNIEACGYEGDEQEAAMQKFNAFRNKNNADQVIMWGKFDQKYFSQVDFMDHQMLRHHLALQLKIALTAAAELLKVKSAQFDKVQQCDQAAKTLATLPAVTASE